MNDSEQPGYISEMLSPSEIKWLKQRSQEISALSKNAFASIKPLGEAKPAYLPDKIVSGGQTGVDRAGLDAAIQHGIPVGGWCPAGRRAEDGSIPDCYPLQETKARNFAVRTRRNVKDSDGTLVLNLGELEGGTLQTVDYAQKIGKPCMVLQLDSAEHPEVDAVIIWLKMHSIKTLNIAGPRESKRPGTYQESCLFLEQLICRLQAHVGEAPNVPV